MKKEVSDEFNKNCGEILRLGVALDEYIEQFILNYFSSTSVKRNFFFKENILMPMSFERKKHLFQKICRLEDWDCTFVFQDIGFVQNIRNKVAHDLAFMYDEDIWVGKVGKGKFISEKEKNIQVNSKLVEEVRAKNQVIATTIMKLMNKNSPDRI